MAVHLRTVELLTAFGVFGRHNASSYRKLRAATGCGGGPRKSAAAMLSIPAPNTPVTFPVDQVECGSGCGVSSRDAPRQNENEYASALRVHSRNTPR